MSDRLIDTNILVYAYDSSEGKRHEVANELLKKIWQEGGGVVCLQNLMEFFVGYHSKSKDSGDYFSGKDCDRGFSIIRKLVGY